MKPKEISLHNLIDIDSADAVRNEVRLLTGLFLPDTRMPLFERCFHDVIRLFTGTFEGYQPCSTQYHDLRHTMDVLLATARLLHSFFLSGRSITAQGAEVVLIAALMHDIGYIQENGDDGTGGKYTLVHVERSASFFNSYARGLGLSDDAVAKGCCMITSTSLAIPISSIDYPDEETELLSKLLATADLLGQLADRLYLEKLLFLFDEFQEAGVTGLTHEFDLINQTRDFYVMVRRRLDEDLGGLGSILQMHFRERWQTDKNLYEESIISNLQYLDVVINEQKNNFLSKLKRGGIVERLIRTDRG